MNYEREKLNKQRRDKQSNKVHQKRKSRDGKKKPQQDNS